MVRAEILTLLNELMGAYPYVNIKDPETTARIFEMSLGEYEAKHVFMATRIYIKKNKFFPSASQIIELIPKGKMLCEVEEEKIKQKALEANRQVNLPAPNGITLVDYTCPLHEGECVLKFSGLCKGPKNNICEFEDL